MKQAHGERKHSKYSASGSERWFNCQGSVFLSEGLPDVDSIWSIEGTKAHEVLETIMSAGERQLPFGTPKEMVAYGRAAADFILNLAKRTPHSEIMVETRISLPFIHSEMFGTFDGAVVDHFGTLHVFDYKYGAGHAVSPGRPDDPNLQMAFYGVGLAHKFGWNFKAVRLWIIQPRIKGYDGPTFVELSIGQLKVQAQRFIEAVARVEENPKRFVEGSWCHWCKAKKVCPLKTSKKLADGQAFFKTVKTTNKKRK
jgi:hypothetical protein